MKRLLLFLVLIPTLAFAAFTDQGGVIKDSSTNLLWCKQVVRSSHTEAVANTASFTCAGYGDWRMPTKDELEAIVDNDNYPKIAPEFGWTGRYPVELNCWSSTADPNADDWVPALRNRYMLMSFETGKAFSAIVNQPHSVLYVRPEEVIDNPIHWDSGGDEMLWSPTGDHVEWN